MCVKKIGFGSCSRLEKKKVSLMWHYFIFLNKSFVRLGSVYDIAVPGLNSAVLISERNEYSDTFGYSKMGSAPPSPPRSSFLGGQQAECAMGK